MQAAAAIPKPNYTQIPNIILDEFMRVMDVAELKVVLAAARKIFGYHKTNQGEPISISQFEGLTGLSRQGVTDGLKRALERGVLIVAGKGKRGVNLYTLNISNEGSTSQVTLLVNNTDQSSSLTSTSQVTLLDKPSTSQVTRHTKEIKTKEKILNKHTSVKNESDTSVPSTLETRPHGVQEELEVSKPKTTQKASVTKQQKKAALSAKNQLTAQDPLFEPIAKHILGRDADTVRANATFKRVRELIDIARQNFEAQYPTHFEANGWTPELNTKCANALKYFVEDWRKRYPALENCPQKPETFDQHFATFLGSCGNGNKPAPPPKNSLWEKKALEL